MTNYTVADCIIQIKNASLARRKTVVLPYSKMSMAICALLAKVGYLVTAEERDVKGRKMIVATLRFEKMNPVITDVKIISRPSLRRYATKNRMPRTRKGLGITLVSTNQGVMTSEDAIKKGVGGEVLFRVT